MRMIRKHCGFYATSRSSIYVTIRLCANRRPENQVAIVGAWQLIAVVIWWLALIIDGVNSHGVQQRLTVFNSITQRLAIELVHGNIGQVFRHKLGKRRWPVTVLATVSVQSNDRHDGITFLCVEIERRRQAFV